MKDLNKRLIELEKRIKSAGDSAFWIDGKNATVRVDVNRRRGKDFTFPSVYEARVWLEKQMDAHAGGLINYCVDNICDLEEDAQTLRDAVKQVLPGVITVQQTTGVVIGGAVQPELFDADTNFWGILAARGVPAGMKADIRLWCLANLITRYFDNWKFKERWLSDMTTDEDNQMFLALISVYVWANPGKDKDVFDDFGRLLIQVAKLPVKEATDARP